MNSIKAIAIAKAMSASLAPQEDKLQ